jgi:hypothetical protein
MGLRVVMPSSFGHMEFAFRADTERQKGCPEAVNGEIIGEILWDFGETSVPRYFFTIRNPDGENEDDPHGTILPNNAAALIHAERTIAELQREYGYDHPGLMLIVKDETRRTVLSLPFLPGCA